MQTKNYKFISNRKMYLGVNSASDTLFASKEPNEKRVSIRYGFDFYSTDFIVDLAFYFIALFSVKNRFLNLVDIVCALLN